MAWELQNCILLHWFFRFLQIQVAKLVKKVLGDLIVIYIVSVMDKRSVSVVDGRSRGGPVRLWNSNNC